MILKIFKRTIKIAQKIHPCFCWITTKLLKAICLYNGQKLKAPSEESSVWFNKERFLKIITSFSSILLLSFSTFNDKSKHFFSFSTSNDKCKSFLFFKNFFLSWYSVLIKCMLWRTGKAGKLGKQYYNKAFQDKNTLRANFS